MAIVDNNGMWIDKRGNPTHKDLIRVDEQLRDEFVEELCKKAIKKQEILREFKKEAFEDIESYYEMLLQKYGLDAKSNSKKGNLSLENFSGTFKITVSVSDRIEFDEKLNIAKVKLDEFFKEATKDANPVIKTLITKAFEVDKKGNVNTKEIMKLKSYEIEHPKWQEAMEIIDDATQIVSSRSYIRFYKRESIEKPWKQISLDFSSI